MAMAFYFPAKPKLITIARVIILCGFLVSHPRSLITENSMLINPAIVAALYLERDAIFVASSIDNATRRLKDVL